MPRKSGTIIKLRGGHSTFVARRKPSDLVDEMTGMNSNECWFVQPGKADPEDMNKLVIRPSDVVAFMATDADPEGTWRFGEGSPREKQIRRLADEERGVLTKLAKDD